MIAGTPIRSIAFAGLLIGLGSAMAVAASRPLAPPADQAAKIGHPGWLVEQNHGCWIWDFKPAKNEVVTWSGACAPDGPATGDGVMEWKGNLRYYGAMKDGRKTGHGSQVTSEGDQYDGDYQDGVFSGHGVYIWADGARYEGAWKASVPEGHGVYTERNVRFDGEWKNGCYRYGGGKTYLIMIDDAGSCD
jgi:hypothetical protein